MNNQSSTSAIEVIFENEDFLVLNKVNGLSTQENDNYSDSVEKRLRLERNELAILPRCGIVHRLDKETTGVLLVAKNEKYLFFLRSLFKERKIEKTYFSLHRGKPEVDHGDITFFLRKSFGRNRKVMMKVDPFEGKLVKIYFELFKFSKNFSLLKIKPLTGRTHQIRLALQKIDLPIYNDHLYNKEKPVSDDGQYLHASSLSFTDGKKNFSFTAEFPTFFAAKLQELEISLPDRMYLGKE